MTSFKAGLQTNLRITLDTTQAARKTRRFCVGYKVPFLEGAKEESQKCEVHNRGNASIGGRRGGAQPLHAVVPLPQAETAIFSSGEMWEGVRGRAVLFKQTCPCASFYRQRVPLFIRFLQPHAAIAQKTTGEVSFFIQNRNVRGKGSLV